MLGHRLGVVQRQPLVETVDRLPQPTEQRSRGAVPASQNRHRACIAADVRQVDERLGLFADGQVLGLAGDPDHLKVFRASDAYYRYRLFVWVLQRFIGTMVFFVIALGPLIGGIAYVGGGPLTRQGGPGDLDHLEASLRALRAEYVGSRHLVLRVSPPVIEPDRRELVFRIINIAGDATSMMFGVKAAVDPSE